jgi:hypothetical protein
MYVIFLWIENVFQIKKVGRAVEIIYYERIEPKHQRCVLENESEH